MVLRELNHCSIRTVRLEETKDFFEALGLEIGERPDFDFPGYWFYLDGQAVVHLVGVDPDNPQGLIDYLGDRDSDGLEGSGNFDHMAFTISEPTDLIARLKDRNISFRERVVPDMRLRQIFLEDPNGVTLELNYFDSADRSPDDEPAKTARGVAPSTSREEMLGRAQDLIPALKERAMEAEKLRRLPEVTINEFHETGLWRLVQPARVGGGELDYALTVEVAEQLARGCGSTGWVFINLATHHWMLGMWPPEAQDAVWGENPDTLIATSLIYPAGRAKPVEGGYELSGRWPFCSGILHSDWIILGGMVATDAGDAAPEPRMFLAPKSSIEVIDTWDVVGLVGTGSLDTACEDLFVPAHMTLGAHEVKGGPTPGSEVNPAALYRLPVAALFPHLIAAPLLGMAASVRDTCVGAMRARVSTYNKSKVSDHATTQLRISRAAASIDAARLLLVANCHEATRIAVAGKVPSIEDKMRWRRDAAFAATLSADGANQLCRTTGGSAIYKKNPLQRQIRDLNAGLGHIGVSEDVNGVGYGRVALGLPSDSPNV